MKVREKFPILDHQDAIGATIFLTTVASLLAVGYFYLTDQLAWYFVIPMMAFPISILHEMEHDLIHNQYFKGNFAMQSLMFAVIWLMKFHANPWWRRDIHHWHHRVSGQKTDIEERVLGLGMDFGVKRLGTALHPFGSVTSVPQLKKDCGPALDLVYMNRSSIATAIIVNLVIKAFPIVLALRYFEIASCDSIYPFLRDFSVLILYPLVLRQACLVLMTTGIHYYGDIPEHDVFFQNQIMDHWAITPFQMFCWWFGATHIIHHYIPDQPFYLRSLISKPVHKVMIANGVRKNDWGVYLRGNRWNVREDQQSFAAASAFLYFGASILLGSFFVYIWDWIIGRTILKITSRFFTIGIVKTLNGDYKKQRERDLLVAKGVLPGY